MTDEQKRRRDAEKLLHGDAMPPEARRLYKEGRALEREQKRKEWRAKNKPAGY